MYTPVSDPSVQADEGRHLTERGAFERTDVRAAGGKGTGYIRLAGMKKLSMQNNKY